MLGDYLFFRESEFEWKCTLEALLHASVPVQSWGDADQNSHTHISLFFFMRYREDNGIFWKNNTLACMFVDPELAC